MRLPRRAVFFFILFCGCMAAFMVLHYGGTLMRDLAMRRETMAPHLSARILSAKCTRYYFLVSACSIEYDDRFVMPATSKKFKSRPVLNYLVFGSVAGERVRLLHPVSQPNVVTTSAGMAHLGNRAFTFFALVTLCLLIPVGILLKAFGGGRRSSAVAPEPAETVSAEEMIARQIQAQAPNRSDIAPPRRPPSPVGNAAPAATFGRRNALR